MKIKVWRYLSLSLAVVGTMAFSSCDDDDDDMVPEPDDIVDVVVENPNFSILESAVITAGLDDDLSGTGPFTVFAPTDAAFGDFISDNGLTADALLSSADLADILSYHVVSGNVTSADVEAGPVTSLTGDMFYVSVDPDGGIWINGNTMITAVDEMASNGVIHTLDYVITAPTQSIAEIAVASTTAATPEFTQLVAALTRAGLVDAVSGGMDDNLTVFAPTDAAFQDLYDALGVSGVDEIDIDLLTDVLTYHVVPARAFSQDLRDGAELPTLLEGQNLTVDLPGLTINESSLVPSMLNIHATNGVIHVIDQVILPE
ncbi:Uncaracterized surface protein containing fasciclin (FAS1) repeats [Algoriphagus locisalis]|uniref:Uncaracterized surface protein containing fasciclin (FAS1) repeats n=1 Tax=Algoriphagus locisalis TaxID=305507 RepID=A0A1I7AQZ8_9BACT|nr:fasciclin domain-containing protein [Algoriphagus locisalis]SFT77320.1 Uncaracterized surface protein containing fasciclin (FAS1) repeats [Algoriphagus locisalis]